MKSVEMHGKAAAAADYLLSEPAEIGLYELCSHAKYDLRISDDGEIRRLTLDVAREMLRRGAQVDFDQGIPKGRSNLEKTPDEIVARIDREWAALGRLPDIGDICHFEWTPAAMEAYDNSKLDSRPS